MELFIHGVGIPEVRDHAADPEAFVRDLVQIARDFGFPSGAEVVALVFVDDRDEPVHDHSSLKDAGICDGSSIHVHTCRHVAIKCNYGSHTKEDKFAPNARVRRIKDVFAHEFRIDPHDFGSFVLLTCKDHAEPDENTRIGTLTTFPICEVCFDLVKRENVQG